MNLNNTVQTTMRLNVGWISRLTALQLIGVTTSLIACAQINNQLSVMPVLIISCGGLSSGGVYPNYKIEVYQDGLIRYNGKLYVKVLGDQQAKITQEQVQKLVLQTRNRYDLLKSIERKTGLNLTKLNGGFLLKLQDTSETFEVYGFRDAHDVLETLNKMAPVKNWICFSKTEVLGQRYGCPIP